MEATYANTLLPVHHLCHSCSLIPYIFLPCRSACFRLVNDHRRAPRECYQIRENMINRTNGDSPLQFVLISGHDTTLISLLASIAPNSWDQQWPPYASLASIELLRVGDSVENEDVRGDYFRFVYNGQVLKIEGCDEGEIGWPMQCTVLERV